MKNLVCLLLWMLPVFAWAGPKAIGNVEMKNGNSYTNAEVEIPAGTMEEFKIKVDGKKMKIQSADVESLLLWHAANPDKKYLMKYADRREIDYDNNVDKLEELKKWFVLFAPGDNVSVWIYAGGINISKNSINMSPVDTRYGYNTFYNFWKEGESCPIFMKFNRKREVMEKWLSTFFADDRRIAAKILNGDYRAQSTKDSRRHGTMLCPILVEKIAEDYFPMR